jgi:hypothetical protein
MFPLWTQRHVIVTLPLYLLAVCMGLRRSAKSSVSHQAYKAFHPHVFYILGFKTIRPNVLYLSHAPAVPHNDIQQSLACPCSTAQWYTTISRMPLQYRTMIYNNLLHAHAVPHNDIQQSLACPCSTAQWYTTISRMPLQYRTMTYNNLLHAHAVPHNDIQQSLACPCSTAQRYTCTPSSFSSLHSRQSCRCVSPILNSKLYVACY